MTCVWHEMKSKESWDICKLCCCECVDVEEGVCCHTTEIGDCDCHDKEDDQFGEHPYRILKR